MTKSLSKYISLRLYCVRLGGFFAFVFLCVGLINVSITSYAYPYVSAEVLGTGKSDVALVLGSQVYPDGRLSGVVQARADAAISLWKNEKVKKILVSGDNRTRWYDEVTAIKNYLLAEGVPASEVFLDYAGLDTYDSVYRAQYIFGVTSMIIPTQEFHVARAVYLAQKLGIEVHGIVVGPYALPQLPRLYVREFFARAKAWYDIAAGSLPHHLGEPISLDGPSNSE